MAEHEGIWSEYRPTYWDGWSAVKRMGGLVRCRDCKHSSVSFDETRTTCRYWSMNDYDDSESSHGYTLYPVVQPDGFCAWGKRKEGE